MDAADILNKHNLKRTSCREGIITVLMKAKHALSENEIRERQVGNYDRTTFYRSFKTLEDRQIIHKIIVDNQLVKYAVGISAKHREGHVHFYCNECNTVHCLEHLSPQKYSLPEGYQAYETEVLIKGICSKCESGNN